tara:strand:+ start:262 stop:417 length:156 start_codon:yes stop_codon:yes gene_type:complete
MANIKGQYHRSTQLKNNKKSPGQAGTSRFGIINSNQSEARQELKVFIIKHS